jgi:uncharacterized protein (TIGR02058 family)
MDMAKKRYIIELGSGIDLHGQDYTEAAKRAVQNAISDQCLCGLSEILDLKDPSQMLVDVIVAATEPDRVDEQAVLEVLPFGNKNIKVVEGGMSVPGMLVESLGDKTDAIVMVNAAVTVSLEI